MGASSVIWLFGKEVHDETFVQSHSARHANGLSFGEDELRRRVTAFQFVDSREPCGFAWPSLPHCCYCWWRRKSAGGITRRPAQQPWNSGIVEIRKVQTATEEFSPLQNAIKTRSSSCVRAGGRSSGRGYGERTFILLHLGSLSGCSLACCSSNPFLSVTADASDRCHLNERSAKREALARHNDAIPSVVLKATSFDLEVIGFEWFKWTRFTESFSHELPAQMSGIGAFLKDSLVRIPRLIGSTNLVPAK